MPKNIKVWECKIGGKRVELPDGADAPLRQAVQKAYFELTGTYAEFCFSGWGGKLDEIEIEIAYKENKDA